jgi:hypothetical protein
MIEVDSERSTCRNGDWLDGSSKVRASAKRQGSLILM